MLFNSPFFIWGFEKVSVAPTVPIHLVQTNKKNHYMNALKDRRAFIKNLQLILSVILIIPVAFVYGSFPNTVLSKLFDMKVETINLTNIFRAMMGLYLAIAAIWIFGIIKPEFWRTATITNIAFMGGLAFGRILSLVLDGWPSLYFSAGLVVELAFAFWGWRNLKKQ